MTTLTTNGHAVDTSADALGEFATSNHLLDDTAGLREALTTDVYLFFRGLFDPATVLAARHEILTKFAILGEVDDRHPIDDAVAGDGHAVGTANLRA